MSHQAIERLNSDHDALLKLLREQGEVSAEQTVIDDYRKILVLATASYFEHQISEALVEYVSRKSAADSAVVAMVRTKVIKRQYHTYFDWENKKAGTFFSLLGEDIGEGIRADTKNGELKAALDAFLDLGYLRNCLVHQNFVSYSFEKTPEEVWELYLKAKRFVEHVEAALRA